MLIANESASSNVLIVNESASSATRVVQPAKCRVSSSEMPRFGA